MSGKEQIIDSILQDAAKYAESMRAVAAKKAVEIAKCAEAEAGVMRAAADAEAEARGEEFVKNGLLSAELGLKRYELVLKRELISRCFDTALKKLTELSKDEHLKLLSRLLKYAESGECVVICKKDRGVVTQEWLDKNAAGKKLTLAKEFGEFAGGILLSGKDYDKNLTFEVLIQEQRDEAEQELSKILFR